MPKPWSLLPLLLAFALRPVAAQDGDAVVIVNGRPIARQALVERVLESHGLQVMQQMIVLELAQEETRRLKLKVTPADIQREFERALERIAPPAGAAGNALSDAERRQSLEMLLQQKCLSMTEFMLGMERNAHLRKVIEHSLKVDEATLREEFARLHGEKVEVRHIQVDEVAGLHEALNRLNRGEDFADVARAVSRNADSAARGGLLEPFTHDDPALAPVLRDQAFAMQPGEVSKPIRVGQWWHILRVERRLPPADVNFDDVRTQVEQSLRDRVVPLEMNRLITTLFQKAEIRVLDGTLRAKFDQLMRDSPPADPTLR